MAVFKCLVGLKDGYVVKCDGIEYEGKLWLVPTWSESLTKPIAIPKRIIRFDTFPHQKTEDSVFDYENVLLPISEADLIGKMPSGIEYVDHPRGISVPIHELRRH